MDEWNDRIRQGLELVDLEFKPDRINRGRFLGGLCGCYCWVDCCHGSVANTTANRCRQKPFPGRDKIAL